MITKNTNDTKDMNPKEKEGYCRRGFIVECMIAYLGAVASSLILCFYYSCNGESSCVVMPLLHPRQIGCWSTSTVGTINFVDVGANLEIIDLSDDFQDKIGNCRVQLKEKRNIEYADDNCFEGFENCKEVVNSKVDVVLLCTSAYLHSPHLETVLNTSKYAFVDKPLAIDLIRAKSVLVFANKVEATGLSILSGTTKRWNKDIWERYCGESIMEKGQNITIVSAKWNGIPNNYVGTQTDSTLLGTTGRISAYSGKDVSWEEVMNSDLCLGPKTYAFGPVPGIPVAPPVVSEATTPDHHTVWPASCI